MSKRKSTRGPTLNQRIVQLLRDHGGAYEVERNNLAKQLNVTPNTLGVTLTRLRYDGVIAPWRANNLYELADTQR